MRGYVLIYILLMAGVTYLIRALPFTLFRRKITSPFWRSFFYYVPYAVLAAMTFPAVFSSAGSVWASLAGVLVAGVLAMRKKSLTVVALSACAAAFAAEGLLYGFVF